MNTPRRAIHLLRLAGLTAALASCGALRAPPAEVQAERSGGPRAASTLALPADALRISSSTASSANSSSTTSQKSWDDSLSTWWSANGTGQWVRYDLGSEQTIDAISLAFYRGANRKATFDVELSRDGSSWVKVLSRHVSSGSTTSLERYDISDQSARFVRITNHGNTENTAIGLTEAVIHGPGGSDDGGDSGASGIVSATASSSNSSTATPGKSFDGTLGTWWGANGTGQWIRYDLGSSQNIDAVSLAWYRGANRKATFDVELSRDGSSWVKVLSRHVSSGSTTSLERYDISDQSARYLRITNHGNTENSAIGITEAAVRVSGSSGGMTGKAFYLDCSGGSDSNNGTSSSSAWRSISKVNSSWLNPGDRLLLKRGCSWTGPLNLRWNGTSAAPITIDAYGDGDLPLIRNGSPGAVSVSGSYQVIQNLQVTADQPGPYKYAIKCTDTPNGWRIGFSMMSGSHHNTVQYSRAYGLTAGVHLASGSARNKVLRNRLTDNTVMSSNTNDPNLDNSGAWGVLINGDHNEVAWNYFSGNSACSEKYTIEGASLEVFKASGNYFHHNTSINDTTFSELGGKPDDRAENNVYAYNLFAPLNTPYKTGELLVVRGWDSVNWGANPGTKFYNNTAFNVNLGIACGSGCDSSILSARNNIIVVRSDATKPALQADGAFDEGNNIYWRLGGGDPNVSREGGLDSTSKITDPKLIDPWNRNFHLQATSPAVDGGVYGPVQDLSITVDLDGKDNTVGAGPDLGAFERQ